MLHQALDSFFFFSLPLFPSLVPDLFGICEVAVLPASVCLRSFRVAAFYSARPASIASGVGETTKRADSVALPATDAPYNYGESARHSGAYRKSRDLLPSIGSLTDWLPFRDLDMRRTI
jgi:hypothetical protein